MKITKGTWLFAQSPGEGQPATNVRQIKTPHLFERPFASENPKLLQKLRSYLTGKVGIPVSQVLAEIDAKVESVYPAMRAGAPPPQPIARHIAPVRPPSRTAPVRSPAPSPVINEEEEGDRPVLPEQGIQEDLLPAVSENGSAKEPESERQKSPSGTLVTHNGLLSGRRVGELPLDDED